MAETGNRIVHLLFVTFIRATKNYFGQPKFSFRLSDGQPENFLKNQACQHCSMSRTLSAFKMTSNDVNGYL